MNLFTVNQVNQVFVAKTLKEGNAALTTLGDIKLKTTNEDKTFSFEHYGKGGITRSDIIDPKTVTYVNATPAGQMTKKLKSAFISLNSAVVSSSNVGVVGEDFLLRLAFSNYVGISPEDTQYWKYGMVHSTANMSTDDFYFKLAKSIVANMSREAATFIKVYLTKSVAAAFSDTTNQEEVTLASTAATLTGILGITVAIQEPDWIKGLKQQKPMNFEVTPTPISVLNGNGTYDEVVWGDVTYSDGVKYTGGSDMPTKSIVATVPASVSYENGKLAADYEYFFHGERGDQYRFMGWPDYIPTEYMVDPTKTYDFVTVHFAYRGPNEDVQRSGKDITILVERTGNEDSMSTLSDVASNLKNAIDAAISA